MNTQSHLLFHSLFQQLLGDALRIRQRVAFADKPIEIMFSKGTLSDKVDDVIQKYLDLKSIKSDAELSGSEEAIQQYRNDMKVFLSNPINRQVSELYKFSTVKITTNYVKPEKKKKSSLSLK